MMVIPSECQIGAHTYKIRWSKARMDSANLRGESDYRDQIIRLLPGRSPSQTTETLIHELLHIVSIIYYADLKEKEVLPTSEGLAQALMSLGFEPDFSQIPDEEL